MRLAGHLKMTLQDLLTNMSSREFAYWVAYHRYVEPIGGDWDRAGLVASATLAPYCPRGKTPKPRDFIPVLPLPMHDTQIDEQLKALKEDMEQG